MKYLLQIYTEGTTSVWESLSEDQQNAVSGELAARIPAARMGGAIEVRPVVER